MDRGFGQSAKRSTLAMPRLGGSRSSRSGPRSDRALGSRLFRRLRSVRPSPGFWAGTIPGFALKFPCCVCGVLHMPRTGWTPSIVPNGDDYGWNEAVAALAAAQQMSQGPKRIAALKKAGQLRFEADERRKAMRDQERASKLELDRQIRAQRLLKSSDHEPAGFSYLKTIRPLISPRPDLIWRAVPIRPRCHRGFIS
jgi:hypothetical protein